MIGIKSELCTPPAPSQGVAPSSLPLEEDPGWGRGPGGRGGGLGLGRHQRAQPGQNKGRDTACGDFRDVLAVSCSPQTQLCFPSLLGQADPSSTAFSMQFAACGVCDSSSQHRHAGQKSVWTHCTAPLPKGPLQPAASQFLSLLPAPVRSV